MSEFVEIMFDSRNLNINKEIENEKETLDYNPEEHINKMKALYGDEWYWHVAKTDNDCELADRYRQWFYKKGVHPDFNIHTESQKEIILPKIILTDEDWFKKVSDETDSDDEPEYEDEYELAIEIANAEAWEKSEEKKEHDYILRMECLYGKEWCWFVENTNDDGEIAEKYRDWAYEEIKQKYYKDYSRQFKEEEMNDEIDSD